MRHVTYSPYSQAGVTVSASEADMAKALAVMKLLSEIGPDVGRYTTVRLATEAIKRPRNRFPWMAR